MAGQRWEQLLDERDRPHDYALETAVGVPLVTVAGAIGGALAIALAVKALRDAQPDARVSERNH